MIVPGANILKLALSVQGTQAVQWFVATGSAAAGTAGLKQTTFADPVIIQGSFQPVKKSLYQTLGLNLAKVYFNFYVPANVLPTGRNASGDELQINGRRYKVESDTAWFSVDGWQQLLCVDIGAAT